MKSIRCDLPREREQIEIYTFSDLHLGDKRCDIKGIRARIEEVKGKDSAYCILNGDLMNNATKTSVSDCYEEQLTPMQQINQAVELFDPIRDKILAITTGNHEYRTYKKEGINLTEIMAREMQIQDRFADAGALLFIRFGKLSDGHHETNKSGKIRKICYTLYAVHGSGGGRKEGSKAIRLADMASIVDADIYLHSHTHLPMIMKQAFYRTDTRNSKACAVDKLFVNTAASLDYGGYGEAYEFKPASKDTPVIYLDGKRRRMTAKL